MSSDPRASLFSLLNIQTIQNELDQFRSQIKNVEQEFQKLPQFPSTTNINLFESQIKEKTNLLKELHEIQSQTNQTIRHGAHDINAKEIISQCLQENEKNAKLLAYASTKISEIILQIEPKVRAVNKEKDLFGKYYRLSRLMEPDSPFQKSKRKLETLFECMFSTSSQFLFK